MTNLIILLAHYFLLYLYPRIKYELDRMNRYRDMAIQNYTRWLTAAILGLVQSDVWPTPKTYQESNMKWIG